MVRPIASIWYVSFLVLLSLNSFARIDGTIPESLSSEPLVEWNPERKLVWSDFRATRKPPGKVPAALSTCGFGFEATEENHRVVSVEIHVTFYQDKSWKNPQHQTDDVLSHEQIHFDITELMGRNFHKEILSLKAKGKLSQRTLKKIYDRISKEHSQLQQLYDKQTNHSLNTKMQDWWAQYISSEIEKTEAFSGYHLIDLER